MSKKLIRQNFRDSVLKRDKHKCVFCNRTEDLDAHHITDRSKMPNGGYVKENGITLCQAEHHMMAERYHITDGLHWYPDMHPNDLYKKINSTFENAVKASEDL